MPTPRHSVPAAIQRARMPAQRCKHEAAFLARHRSGRPGLGARASRPPPRGCAAAAITPKERAAQGRNAVRSSIPDSSPAAGGTASNRYHLIWPVEFWRSQTSTLEGVKRVTCAHR